MNLLGKDLITTDEWSVDEIECALLLAKKMKKNRFSRKFTSILEHKTFFMFFYNPSVRTRQSFECAMTELGGHAQFLEPRAMRLKTKKTAGETVEDASRVMSRYAQGLGIRILEDQVGSYGDGDNLLREYAEYATIPIFSMAHDKFHPFQGLADLMGEREHLGDVNGKKLLMVWGQGALARSYCSVQENLLVNSRFGMHITLAFPEGYDLDPKVIGKVKKYCEANKKTFQITHDSREGYKDADLVYCRNWMSPNAYRDGEFKKQDEIEKALIYKDWICDSDKMELTNNALFIHPMPVDRGNEVTDEIASGNRSIIYDVAENRLHVQKAVLALTMSDFDN